MFGLKGLGGLVGGAFKAIGLGKIAPFVSLGINALTGNFAGVAMDVMGLMSNIKGLDFLNRVAPFAPLGGFGGSGGGCFGSSGFGGLTDLLRPERLKDLASNFRNFVNSLKEFRASAKKVQEMFNVLQETVENRQVVQAGRDHAWINSSARANA